MNLDEIKSNKKIFDDCSKLSISETPGLLMSCKSKEEVGFFKQICESFLQQRQRKVIEERRF